jgi:transposase
LSELVALGLDVGKEKIHASLLLQGGKRDRTFTNNAQGHAAVLVWLDQQGVKPVHACLESTGGWSEALATALFDAGHVVSIVNPSRVKAFAKSELLRTKTDKVDASLIARFCLMHRPTAWVPPPENVRRLQALSRRLDSLIAIRAQELNRLEAPGEIDIVKASIQNTIASLSREIAVIEEQLRDLINNDPDLGGKRDLLVTIKGIGERTAHRILSEMPQIEEFRNARAIAAYAGLSPRQWQSGTLKGRTRISKIGNSRLRAALYWPAIVAMRSNRLIKTFAERLRAAGKPMMVVITAAMRKLLCLAYAVVRSGRAFQLPEAA